MVLILTGLLFAGSLDFAFVWDDIPLLVRNQAYLSLDPVRFFSAPANGLEYLPLRDLSYAADFAIWGMRPFGFHLTNLFLYLLTILAVYLLAKQVTLLLNCEAKHGGVVPLVTALFFAVMPLHSEAVCFITSRNTLLCGLFTFLSAALYLHASSNSSSYRLHAYLLALLLFVLALLSKASGIFLPLMLVLLTLFHPERHWRRLLAMSLPFMLVATAGFLILTRFARQSGILQTGREMNLAAKLAEAVQIPIFYLGKVLLPLKLQPEYSANFATDPKAPLMLGAVLLLVGATVAAWRARSAHRYLLFSLAWFYTSLVPVLHLLPTSTTVADRYLFIPSFACCYVIAAGGAKLADRGREWRRILVVAGLLVIGVWSVLTLRQNRIWQSEESLWLHVLKLDSGSVKGIRNLGWLYLGRGDLAKAAPYLEKARDIDANDPNYAFYRGLLALEQQDFPAAAGWFAAADRYGNHLSALPMYYLALTYEKGGKRELAVATYRSILTSTAMDAHQFRGKVLERLRGGLNNPRD
jgi:tetratricopeptide (TPR) repeat protein